MIFTHCLSMFWKRLASYMQENESVIWGGPLDLGGGGGGIFLAKIIFKFRSFVEFF